MSAILKMITSIFENYCHGHSRLTLSTVTVYDVRDKGDVYGRDDSSITVTCVMFQSVGGAAVYQF